MVSIRELAADLDEYVARAAHGETIVIADGGNPVAELIPSHMPALPDRLNELIRQGLITMPTRPRATLPTEGAQMRPGYSLSDVVIEERRADRLL